MIRSCSNRVTLTEFDRDFVLSALPAGAEIVDARYFDNYNLPCPVKVTAALRGRGTHVVVLRQTRHGDIRREARLLAVLRDQGLSVPELLSGPTEDPEVPNRLLTVLSFLPGQTVQQMATRSSEGCEAAKRLVLDGIMMLADQTEAVRRRSVGDELPRQDPAWFLETIEATRHPWLRDPLVVQTLSWLRDVIPGIDTPLTFTNGDHNAQNFLTDGQRITGIVDFEDACFQDPLLGIAKYPVYDLHPLHGAGFVDYFLRHQRYSLGDFRPRLALWCIRTLIREIPDEGGNAHANRYRTHVIGLLQDICRQGR